VQGNREKRQRVGVAGCLCAIALFLSVLRVFFFVCECLEISNTGELTGVTQGKNKRKKNKIQFRTQFDHRSDLLFSPFLKN